MIYHREHKVATKTQWMENRMTENEIATEIIGCAIDVHKVYKPK
tara:strand:- start:6408 stop:6539 length:132 start_codon:yes stop_codon:yes gene_type:complete